MWKRELESQRRGQKAVCEGLASVAVVTPGLKESWREAEVLLPNRRLKFPAERSGGEDWPR